MKMNIQDEMQKIHNQYGVSEMANYKIEQFIEQLIKYDRAEQLNIPHVIDYYFLKDGDDVLKGDEYENGGEWLCVDEEELPYTFDSDVYCKHRRKL